MLRSVLKTLAWVLLAIVLVVVLALGTVAFIGSTETGLSWLWGKAQGYLPEGITVAQVEGRLIGPLDIHGLEIENPGMRLTLDRLHLEWEFAALLKGNVHVEALSVSGLDYTALASDEPQEPSEPFELPESIDLPVDVYIDALTLEDIAIRTAADAEPFVVEYAHLLARMNGENWIVRELEARGPLFKVSGGALLTPRDKYSNEIKLDWLFRAPDMAVIEGVTEVQGNLGKLQVKQSIAAPYNVAANADLNDVLGDLSLNARVQLDDTHLDRIKADLPKAQINAIVNANGSLSDLNYQLQAKAQESEFGTALLDIAGRYTGEHVEIQQLKLTSPDTPGQLTAKGKVALSEGNAMNVALQWRKLQWPLAGKPQYSSPEGQLTLTGKLQDYKLNGGLRWFLAEAEQEGRLQLSGHGNTESFVLKNLALSGAPGTLEAQANVAWAPALKVTAAINGENFNPGALAPEWPGALDVQIRLNAAQKNDELLANIERIFIDGTLREQPLTVNAQATYSPKLSVVKQLLVRAGQTRLEAQGRLAQENLDFSWSLESSDLGTTVPGAAGTLNGNGRLAGTLSAPVIQAQLSGEDLRYQQNRIAELGLNASIDASGARNSSLKLTARKGDFGGATLKQLNLTGSGTPASHQLSLDADANGGKVALAMDGALPQDFSQWQFVLRQARLAYQELAPWTLAAPAAGQVTAAAQSMEQACWLSGDAKLCLQGENGPQGTQADFSLDDLAFAYLQPFLPPNLQIDGVLSGQGSARLAAESAPDIQISLNTSATTLAARDAKGEAVEALSFAPGTIQVRMTDGLQANVDIPLEQGGGLQLDAQVPGGSAALTERPLSGQIQLAINNLEALTTLVPEIGRAEGQLRGDLALGGSLGAPQINGQIGLQAAVIALEGPGLELKEIDLSVIGKGRDITLALSAKSGGGTLNASGDVGLGDAGATVALKVQGDRFKVLDTRDARVYASPDLTIGVTPERIDVDGTVTIPKADITPKNIPASNGAVTVSDDQIIVKPGSTGEDSELGRALHARVRIIVGDPTTKITDFAERGRNYADTIRRIPGEKVRFEGFGLKAVFAGNLLVTQSPGEPALGSGELRIVVGEYKAYGQDLSIQNGRVLFAGGPVSEPALNIRAVRRPNEEILVGVKVRGQLQQPDFKLFSEPASLTQSEQLSWLVLGRGLGEASAAESSLVTRAALALGAKGGNFLARNIGDRIGVDDIGIESGGADAASAAFVVGKYLTPKLYVSYGIGLFRPVSTVRLRYILSPRWQLETQSNGTATGGDVIFSIERGGD